MGYRVVVAGATGNVGREILNILDERLFPIDDIAVLASRRSLGTECTFGDKTLKTKDLDTFDFSDWDVALFAVGSEATQKYARAAAKSGCVVIDNSSLFRNDPRIPLIVPEVNPDAIFDYKEKNIIANPNCSTAQLVVALKPLHDRAKIKRVVVSTYQSVSGSGKAAMDELWDQTKNMFSDQIKDNINFTKSIAFNAIPHIGKFMDDGYTKEEAKMRQETNKILDKDIQFSATCVRVPVFIGHAEAVNIEFENKISVDQARKAIKMHKAAACSMSVKMVDM
jgi:aspartate-semialdehyde dehydrogenase